MPTYAYHALERNGKRRRGTITAANGRHAREQLRSGGLRVESVTERTTKATTARSATGRTRYRNQLTSTIRELSTLLAAGVPLLDSLDSVLLQSKRGFQHALLSVRDQVASGTSLADAMRNDPSVFDEMTVGMIQVGEHSGNLDQVCEQVADYRERSGELKDRVISAMLYPAIVLVVSTVVTIFLMTAVVPMLLQNLTELGRPLPLPTKVLKYLSDALLNYGPVIFLALAGATFAAIIYARTQDGRLRAERIALSIPVFGTLTQKQAISRMALVVSTLLRSGVELVDALEIAERSATNQTLKLALAKMRQDLNAGHDLREAALRHRIFPPTIAQVFSLGQQSGQLDTMLLRVGNDYDRQAAQLASRFATIVEPALVLVLSVVVAFILFAVVLPILEAGNVLAG